MIQSTTHIRVIVSLVLLVCICTLSGCARINREFFEDEVPVMATSSSGRVDLSKKYRLQNLESTECVTMPKDGDVTMKPCDIALTDQNVMLDSDGEYYVIKSVAGDQCLYDNVGDKFGKQDCSTVTPADQHWMMGKQALGKEGPIVNSTTARCLSGKEGKISPSICDDSVLQQWRLVQQNL